MDESKKNFLKNICKYCINNFIISNSGPIIPSLIYELCKFLDMDAMAVRGILTIHINNQFSRSFAHCFNICDGIIIDSTIYQYAIMNRQIEHIIPMYIVENFPYYIDYTIQNELPQTCYFKFSEKFLKNTIRKLQSNEYPNPKKFDIIQDSKKHNLFFNRQL